MDLITGPLVSGLLTLAVAIIGFRLLFGRKSIRQGAFVLVGGFILIGSAHIAQSLVDAVPRASAVPASADTAGRLRELPGTKPAPPARRRGNPFDPYAGNEPVN